MLQIKINFINMSLVLAENKVFIVSKPARKDIG